MARRREPVSETGEQVMPPLPGPQPLTKIHGSARFVFEVTACWRRRSCGPQIAFYPRSEVRSTLYSRLRTNRAHPARSKAAAIGLLATSVSAGRGFSFPPRASRSVAVPAASSSSATLA